MEAIIILLNCQLSLNPVILLPLRPASLTHKNPQRHKIIHGMRPVGCKEWSIWRFFGRISCLCDFCGCCLKMHIYFSLFCASNTAVSKKVVGKSACDNPKRYCGWFCLPCSLKKFEWMTQEATDICSQVLVESNKSRFDSYSG